MNRVLLGLTASALLTWSAAAQAVYTFQGSDTLAGALSDAIIAAGMNTEISYVVGGSGKAETAMINGEQGIGPMSRDLKPEAVEQAQKNGIGFNRHVIALDGVGLFVNSVNTVAGLTKQVIADIYTCKITQWENVPGSNLTGKINAFRRDDFSGTTDTFKTLVGVSKFGDCVSVLEQTIDLAERTSADAQAIGYSGHTAKRDNNRSVAVANSANEPFVELNVNTVRSFAYPLSRSLFIMETTGAHTPNEAEAKLLGWILDRSNMDQIVQDNEFYTVD